MAAKRGLASASAETRARVASAGGRASHGGGRPKTKARKKLEQFNKNTIPGMLSA